MAPVPHRPPNPSTSPLVRGGRYVMLGLGIWYGCWRLQRLSKKEVAIQEHDNAIRAKRDTRLAREKEITYKGLYQDISVQQATVLLLDTKLKKHVSKMSR